MPCYENQVQEPSHGETLWGGVSMQQCQLQFHSNVCGGGVNTNSASQSSCWVLLLPPTVGYNAPYLSVFSENAVDVFDVRKAEWIQTVPLKKVSGLLLFFGSDNILPLALS